jgi:hypothetical protein
MDSISNTIHEYVPDFSNIDYICKNTDHIKFYFKCVLYASAKIIFNEMNNTKDGKEIIIKNMNNNINDAIKCLLLEKRIITNLQNLNLKEYNLDRFINPTTEKDIKDYDKFLQNISDVDKNITEYIELIEKFTEKKILLNK